MEVNGVPVEGLEPEQVINILVLNIFLLCTRRLTVCCFVNMYTHTFLEEKG